MPSQMFAPIIVVGQVGLEPTTALSTGFTVRGDTNYTVLTHMEELVGLEPTSRGFLGPHSTLELQFHLA